MIFYDLFDPSYNGVVLLCFFLSGGTLKIYGESLQPDVPYKTLLLSTADTTGAVIKEAMEKYSLEKEDPEQFCLVEVSCLPSPRRISGLLICYGVVGQTFVMGLWERHFDWSNESLAS